MISIGGGGHSIMGQGTIGSPTININNWSSSVTDQQSVLIGFFEDSFIPLYNLIPNVQKAYEVKGLIYSMLGLNEGQDVLSYALY